MVHGQPWQIVDVGMRMFDADELFWAQSFRRNYDITCERTYGKKLTKTDQVRLAGNSVPPKVARVLVGANLLGASWRAAA